MSPVLVPKTLAEASVAQYMGPRCGTLVVLTDVHALSFSVAEHYRNRLTPTRLRRWGRRQSRFPTEARFPIARPAILPLDLLDKQTAACDRSLRDMKRVGALQGGALRMPTTRLALILILSVLPISTRADCERDVQDLKPVVTHMQDHRIQRRAQDYLKRAVRELDEGDDFDCQTAVDAINKMMLVPAPH